MALVKCKSCGTEVDEDIDKCPRCESLGPKRSKRVRWILLAAMAVIVVVFAIGYYVNFYNVKERPYEEIVKERHEDRLSQRGVAAALLLRTRLDNPESMTVDKALSNQDGSVLCFEYRAQVKTGGQKSGKAAFVDGELYQDAAAWKLFCVGKSLHKIKVESKALR